MFGENIRIFFRYISSLIVLSNITDAKEDVENEENDVKEEEEECDEEETEEEEEASDLNE